MEVLEPLIYSTTYTLRLAPIIALGIFTASYAVKKGFLEKLNPIIHPLAKLARLNDISAMAVLTSTLSSTAAYSILAESHRNNEISERELIATTMITSFPSILSHLFTYFLPVVIPILGLKTGSLYLGIRLTISGIKSIIGVLLARSWLKTPCIPARHHITPASTPEQSPLRASLKTTGKNILRISSIMLLTLYIVTVLKNQGALDTLTLTLQPIASALHLQSEILLISTTEILNKYAGLVMAADFQNTHILSTSQVIIALLIGNIVSFSTRFLRVSIPLHISLFGPRTGAKTIAINTLFTVLLDLSFVILIMKIT